MNEEPTIPSIEDARKRFNEDLHSGTYAQVHADSEQLRGLLSFLAPEPGQVFLDLGTGSGYVGMSLARQFPDCSVIGLDIAERALQQNVAKAKEKGILNIQFQVSNGIALPFDDGCLDGVICRYTFHHLPRYEKMLSEVSRTVRAGGRLVLSDPLRDNTDTTDFINSFQSLKKDGHVRIHGRREFLELVEQYGFAATDSFGSTIAFSRDRTPEYDSLLDSTPTSILDAYRVKRDEERICITFEVLNVLFRKRPAALGDDTEPDVPASGRGC